MRYCPQCGAKLGERLINDRKRTMCSACQFIDWDTWMNVAAVVVAYKEDQEFAMVRMKNQQAGTLTFPQGFRELGETITETAQREFLEETGHHAINLKLFDIYTSDTKRLIWIIYTATLGKGTFRENPETSELLLYSKTNPPQFDELRGSLTRRLLGEILRG
jgi:NADH pyrophosphatase NudC (nudix superfamily)